jgi:hypothetical protein
MVACVILMKCIESSVMSVSIRAGQCMNNKLHVKKLTLEKSTQSCQRIMSVEGSVKVNVWIRKYFS